MPCTGAVRCPAGAGNETSQAGSGVRRFGRCRTRPSPLPGGPSGSWRRSSRAATMRARSDVVFTWAWVLVRGLGMLLGKAGLHGSRTLVATASFSLVFRVIAHVSRTVRLRPSLPGYIGCNPN